MAGNIKDRLPERLRELRGLADLSQEAFAERAHIPYKYYQAMESGRRRDFRLTTLEKLATAHRIEVWELLKLPRK